MYKKNRRKIKDPNWANRLIDILEALIPGEGIIVPIGTLLVIIGFGKLLIGFQKNKPFDTTTIYNLIPFIIIGILFIVAWLFKFLNNDRNERKTESLSTYLMRQQILESQKNIESAIQDVLNRNPEVLNVERTISEKIVSNLEVSLINKLNDRFEQNIKKEFIVNTISSELIPLTRNIEKYIDRIQRNSIVNLFIGIAGTIAAITILAFAILSNREFSDFTIFIIHFLPRFTFVIFIQLFAFFFLNLYKSNLEDAKYFQNELTNLTAKSSSIKLSYLLNQDKMGEIIKDLSTIERNFKLLKDESTIGLEKAKLDSEFDKGILDQFRIILDKYKKDDKL